MEDELGFYLCRNRCDPEEGQTLLGRGTVQAACVKNEVLREFNSGKLQKIRTKGVSKLPFPHPTPLLAFWGANTRGSHITIPLKPSFFFLNGIMFVTDSLRAQKTERV